MGSGQNTQKIKRKNLHIMPMNHYTHLYTAKYHQRGIYFLLICFYNDS